MRAVLPDLPGDLCLWPRELSRELGFAAANLRVGLEPSTLVEGYLGVQSNLLAPGVNGSRKRGRSARRNVVPGLWQ